MKQNVLIIEENKAIRFLLNTTLQRAYKTFDTSDVYDGLNILNKHTIDLIILSVDAADTIQYEFISHLKSSSILSHIPVLIVTNSLDPIFLQNLFENGVHQVFPKPFDPILILNEITRIVEEKEQQKSSTMNKIYESNNIKTA